MLKQLSNKRFAKLSLSSWLWIVGSILLLGATSFWWFGVQTQPRRVFNDMLGQSLRTNGVTVQTEQTGQNGKAQYFWQYSLGSTNQARVLTKLEQGEAKVATETIGTSDSDYTRYVSIELAPSEEGQAPDVSNIQNVWSKGPSNVFEQSSLGLNLPVPIGNVAPEKRESLLDFIRSKEVYKVDYQNVKTEHKDGRMKYVYDVEIQVILYADLFKRFAQSVGFSSLDDMDPNQFSGAEPWHVKMTVDVRSHQLDTVEVVDSGSQIYTYGGYDIPVSTEIPQETITDTELQRRIGELSGNAE